MYIIHGDDRSDVIGGVLSKVKKLFMCLCSFLVSLILAITALLRKLWRDVGVGASSERHAT